MSAYIRGMGCDGWAYCIDCGGTCSQDDLDRQPYKPTGRWPQLPPKAPTLDDYRDYRRQKP